MMKLNRSKQRELKHKIRTGVKNGAKTEKSYYSIVAND